MTDASTSNSIDAFNDSLIDFDQSADAVAPLLLGGILRFGQVAIRITEVEAYLGETDPASHAFKRPTPRCMTMFGPSSHLYVYASYGIHRAGNLVCSPDGHAGGVLLRGGEVIDGYEVARRRRGSKVLDAALARGPGNLGQAMGLDLELNGAEVRQGKTSNPSRLPVLHFQRASESVDFVAGKRIGISKNVDAPLRFWIPGDPTVSTPRGRPRV